MRIYIKGDYAKKITFTTRELVWKMWFKERNGKKISYSNVGDDEMLGYKGKQKPKRAFLLRP